MLSACGGSSTESAGSFDLLGGNQEPDAVSVDFPLAVIKRDVSGGLPALDVRDPARFQPGAELLLRDRASPSAADISVAAGIFPPP